MTSIAHAPLKSIIWILAVNEAGWARTVEMLISPHEPLDGFASPFAVNMWDHDKNLGTACAVMIPFCMPGNAQPMRADIEKYAPILPDQLRAMAEQGSVYVQ